MLGWGGKGGSVQEGEKRLKQETIKKRKRKISQRNLLFMLLSNPRIVVCATDTSSTTPFIQLSGAMCVVHSWFCFST